MTQRFDLSKAAPDIYRTVLAFSTAAGAGVDETIRHLVLLRASQINRCAFCLDMHTKDARAAGVDGVRLALLPAFDEADEHFTDRERAALALTEAVTVLTDGFVPDAVYERAAAHFDAEELAHLVGLIAAINVWNRLNVTARTPGGHYPRARRVTAAATFRALHHGRAPDDPLVLPGPWDAASARVLAGAGFAALATPSHAIADSLGHRDGATPAAEMFAAIARITRAVDVPVSADVEDGYGLPPAELVERLLEAGAVGCNLEDTDTSGTGALRDPGRQAAYLAAVREAAGDRLFVNARIDSYLRGRGTVAEAVARGRRYAQAGADGVYPITAPPGHLRALAEGIGLPVNALARAGSPPPPELGRLGATRVTFGPGVHAATMAALGALAKDLRTTGCGARPAGSEAAASA